VRFWSEACAGPVILGEELDILRWIEPGRGNYCSWSRAPRIGYSAAVLCAMPATQPCTVIFKNRSSSRAPGYDVVSPGGSPGGVLVDESDRVHVIDKSRSVRLNGGALGARSRC